MFSETFILLSWFPILLVGWTLMQRIKRKKFLKNDRVTIPRYDPPDGFFPAALGTIRDNHLDERDIVAGLISLAVQGYLTISEKNTDGKDYVITQTFKPWPTEDINFDRRLLQSLFGRYYSEKLHKEVLFSELAGKFHRARPLLQVTVEGELRHTGIFRHQKIWLGIESLFAIFCIAGGITWQLSLSTPFSVGTGVWIGGGIISLLILATFPRTKTLRGAEIAYQIRCYREYLTTAESDRVEWQEQQYLYEKHLPYAIALGVADIWSERFDGFAEIPSWFTGTRKMRLKYMGAQFNKLLSWMLSPKNIDYFSDLW